MTQTILTFGDSNTHGTPPMTSRDHHPRLVRRWPVVMAENIDCNLIEDGLGGRTACAQPVGSVEPYLDGPLGLHMALRAHGPIDWLTIMLGTNDLQTRHGNTADAVAASLSNLMSIAHNAEIQDRHNGFRTLLISPPPVLDEGAFAPEFMDAPRKSVELPSRVAHLADRWGCAYLDAGALIASDPRDGVHFNEAAHETLGRAVAKMLSA